jgi:death on curing protein
VNYLYPKQIVYLHQRITAVSGGSGGLRSKHLLESAVYRPQASFGGQDLYPDVFIKAAVLGHSLILNHPFVDGNKRIGFEAMRLTLRLNGHDVRAGANEKFNFVMAVANKEIDEHQIAEWLKKHSRAL